MLEIQDSLFSLDLLLRETLELTEFIGLQSSDTAIETHEDNDFLMDLADSVLAPVVDFSTQPIVNPTPIAVNIIYPESSGVIYKIDESGSTFCIRGYSTQNIKLAMLELAEVNSTKRAVLKFGIDDSIGNIRYFKTKNFELAESIREQIINRRFPKMEDSVCNISDPGFSWWMDVSLKPGEGQFEIYFKSHSINRAEKYIQLGPIGDGAIASLRMNQARTLLRSSFPLSEFVCTERSLTVATNKPDHLSFISFKNIFLLGENNTEVENFPDNSLGRTLYFYFHEIAVLRKFWIEVQNILS